MNPYPAPADGKAARNRSISTSTTQHDQDVKNPWQATGPIAQRPERRGYRGLSSIVVNSKGLRPRFRRGPDCPRLKANDDAIDPRLGP